MLNLNEERLTTMIKLYRKLEELSLSDNFAWAAEHVREWNLAAAHAKGGKLTPLDLQLSFIEEEFNSNKLILIKKFFRFKSTR